MAIYNTNKQLGLRQITSQNIQQTTNKYDKIAQSLYTSTDIKKFRLLLLLLSGYFTLSR